MAKRFVNAPENVVPDLMQGVALDTSRVTLVDPQCGHSIAVRTSLLEQGHPRRVAVVSGGGSGHEPMAAGYVGDGMLAGAVAGSVFASPTVPAIRALLNTVAPLSSGIVVVVMNYTGDRHLFGAAVHNLRITHPNCECAIVVVGDDVALPDASHPRGIAGTIFVLKVACAAADRGLPFEQVVQIAKTASKNIVSYGVALEPCTLPGHPVNTERLGPNEYECGMGIHGEGGVEKLIFPEDSMPSFTNDLVTKICTHLDLALQKKNALENACTAMAIMVNNLGAVPISEMLIVRKAVSNFLFSRHAQVLNGEIYRFHMFEGAFMTSLQMVGISISCFMMSEGANNMEQLLHAKTDVTAWNRGFPLLPPHERKVLPFSIYLESGLHKEDNNVARSELSSETKATITAITTALLHVAEDLASLDRITGDGDMGDTVKRVCYRIQADMDGNVYSMVSGNPSYLFRLLAISIEKSMGGSSGIFTAVFFKTMAESVRRASELSWRAAFADATSAVMEVGGAQVGDRTLIDALKPASDMLSEGKPLREAVQAAYNGFESTKTMSTAKLGRSSKVRSDALLNHGDPGAYAIYIILNAMADVMHD